MPGCSSTTHLGYCSRICFPNGGIALCEEPASSHAPNWGIWAESSIQEKHTHCWKVGSAEMGRQQGQGRLHGLKQRLERSIDEKATEGSFAHGKHPELRSPQSAMLLRLEESWGEGIFGGVLGWGDISLYFAQLLCFSLSLCCWSPLRAENWISWICCLAIGLMFCSAVTFPSPGLGVLKRFNGILSPCTHIAVVKQEHSQVQPLCAKGCAKH